MFYLKILSFFSYIKNFIVKNPALSLIIVITIALFYYKYSNNKLNEDLNFKNEVIELKKQREIKVENLIDTTQKLEDKTNKNFIEFEKQYKKNIEIINNAKENEKIRIEI